MKKKLLLTLFLFGFFFAKNAASQVIDSSFYRWSVYEIQENELEHKKCYIVSFPIKIDSNHPSRERPWIMITRFQKDRSEEVSVFGGFEYKLNSEIMLMIDNRLFKMKAKKDIAWAQTKYGDIAIIQSMLSSALLEFVVILRLELMRLMNIL